VRGSTRFPSLKLEEAGRDPDGPTNVAASGPVAAKGVTAGAPSEKFGGERRNAAEAE